jgi:hypothetical protein
LLRATSLSLAECVRFRCNTLIWRGRLKCRANFSGEKSVRIPLTKANAHCTRALSVKSKKKGQWVRRGRTVRRNQLGRGQVPKLGLASGAYFAATIPADSLLSFTRASVVDSTGRLHSAETPAILVRFWHCPNHRQDQPTLLPASPEEAIADWNPEQLRKHELARIQRRSWTARKRPRPHFKLRQGGPL